MTRAAEDRGRTAFKVRVVLAVSFSISILLCQVLLVRDSRWAPVLAGLCLVAIAAHVATGVLHRSGKPVGWLLTLASLNLFVVDETWTTRIHRQYNQVVRETARQPRAILLDLETEIDAVPSRTLGAIFEKDGIHLTPVGNAVVADRIADAVYEALVQHPPGA